MSIPELRRRLGKHNLVAPKVLEVDTDRHHIPLLIIVSCVTLLCDAKSDLMGIYLPLRYKRLEKCSNGGARSLHSPRAIARPDVENILKMSTLISARERPSTLTCGLSPIGEWKRGSGMSLSRIMYKICLAEVNICASPIDQKTMP